LTLLIAATQEVSRLHAGNGLADPCTAQVTAAFQAIAPIEPPRAWPKDQKARFTELPYGLQKYVAAHEARRETEIRRAHNEAAKARQELAAIMQPRGTSENGIQQNAAA
jgi:serine/threonine protein kinase HipA of HipAB toxin-antitoxin module